MLTSETIADLAAALAKAQLTMTGAKRDADNPYFKSRYADLASVRDACLGALNTNGISVTQWPRLVSVGDHEWFVEVETRLTHASGQWMADTLALPLAKADAQGVGSCITYARRYALAAVAGVAPDDDDGEAAVGRGAPVQRAYRDADDAPAPDKPPAGAGVAIMTTVLNVRQKSGSGKKGPFVKFTVHTPDGDFSTFNRHLAELAKVAKLATMPVEIDYRESQYGLDLLALRDARPEPPL